MRGLFTAEKRGLFARNIHKGENTAKSSMRKILYNELKEKRVFTETESLLETYQYLLKTRPKGGSPPKCPHDNCDADIMFFWLEPKEPKVQGSISSFPPTSEFFSFLNCYKKGDFLAGSELPFLFHAI